MTRTTSAILNTHTQLVAAGACRLTASQLQGAHEAGLGPPDGCLEPNAHWAALDALAVIGTGKAPRLPPADEAAMALAAAGWPCRHLPVALATMAAEQQAVWDELPTVEPGDPLNPLAETEAEGTARAAVEQHRDAAGGLIGDLTRRTKGSADPWPERGPSGGDPGLHKAGLLLAFLTQLCEGADDPARLGSLDAGDLSGVLGGAIPEDSARLGVQLLGAIAGVGVTVAPAMPEDTPPAVMAAAVMAATAMVPLFAALDVAAPRGKRDFWRLVAWTTPAMLAVGRLASDSGAGALLAVLSALANMGSTADFPGRYGTAAE
jgi:hypothetical protein